MYQYPIPDVRLPGSTQGQFGRMTRGTNYADYYSGHSARPSPTIGSPSTGLNTSFTSGVNYGLGTTAPATMGPPTGAQYTMSRPTGREPMYAPQIGSTIFPVDRPSPQRISYGMGGNQPNWQMLYQMLMGQGAQQNPLLTYLMGMM